MFLIEQGSDLLNSTYAFNIYSEDEMEEEWKRPIQMKGKGQKRDIGGL